MSRRHRLTALIVGLLLLPSAAGGGRLGCAMPTGGSDTAAASAIGDEHAAHGVATRHEHGGYSVDAAGSHDANDESSHSSPHAPAECLSATACVGVALGAASDLIASAHPRDAGVAADIALAPLSPAFALEPPPPRA